MKKQFVIAIAVVAGLNFVAAEFAEAKRTPEEKAAKKASSSASKTERVRLQAVFESEEANAEEESELAPQLRVRYRSEKGKIRLDASAENFEAGYQVEAFVDNVSIGVITVEETEKGLEGELSYRDAAEWPAGLPAALTAGMMVKFVDESGAVVASGPLESK